MEVWGLVVSCAMFREATKKQKTYNILLQYALIRGYYKRAIIRRYYKRVLQEGIVIKRVL